jgi:cytidylate kinase
MGETIAQQYESSSVVGGAILREIRARTGGALRAFVRIAQRGT